MLEAHGRRDIQRPLGGKTGQSKGHSFAKGNLAGGNIVKAGKLVADVGEQGGSGRFAVKAQSHLQRAAFKDSLEHMEGALLPGIPAKKINLKAPV